MEDVKLVPLVGVWNYTDKLVTLRKSNAGDGVLLEIPPLSRKGVRVASGTTIHFALIPTTPGGSISTKTFLVLDNSDELENYAVFRDGGLNLRAVWFNTGRPDSDLPDAVPVELIDGIGVSTSCRTERNPVMEDLPTENT